MSRRTRRLTFPILMPTVLGGGSATTPLQEAQALIDGIGSTIKRAWFTHLGTLNQASDGTGDPASADGDPVGRIPDLSTAEDPATQATTANKGLYRPTGVNGFPGIEIATDDFYSFTSLALTSFTIFAVATRSGAQTSVDYLLAGSGGGAYVGGSLGFPTITGYGATDGTNFREASTEPTTPEIFVFKNNALFLNGVEATYADSGNITGLTLTTVGHRPNITSLRFNGVFGSIIIADTNLNNANLNLIGNYLAGVYGKTWTTIT